MNRKQQSYVLLITLSLCLLVSLFLNVFLSIKLLGNKGRDQDSDKKESSEYDTADISPMEEIKGDVKDEAPAEESELNRECRNTSQIILYENYDENDGSFDNRYNVSAGEYQCKFFNDERTGEFSLDVFNELVDTLCKYEIKKYQPHTDESGKVVKTVLPYRLEVAYGQGGTTDLEISNIDELAGKIKELYNNSDPWPEEGN